MTALPLCLITLASHTRNSSSVVEDVEAPRFLTFDFCILPFDLLLPCFCLAQAYYLAFAAPHVVHECILLWLRVPEQAPGYAGICRN